MLRTRLLSSNSSLDPSICRITLITRWLLLDEDTHVYSEEFGCVIHFYPLSRDESFSVSSLESSCLPSLDRLRGEIDFVLRLASSLEDKEV